MPDSNPDVRNPYVWLQIEVLRRVFWATISHFVGTQILYWGVKAAGEAPIWTQNVWVQIEIPRGVFWATISRFVGTQTLYWGVKATGGAPIWKFEPRRKESLRLGSIWSFMCVFCWNTDSILERQSDRRGPNLNPDVRNPYVWVQIEVPRGVFWATISRFVGTQTLYWGVKATGAARS